MADYCLSCNKEYFDVAESDFDPATQEQWSQGYGSLVLCEGCGPVVVDTNADCASPDCIKHGPRNVIREHTAKINSNSDRG